MNKKILIAAVVVLAGAGLVALGVVIARFLPPDNNPLPPEVRGNVTFSSLVIPTDSTGLSASNYGTTTVEDGTKLLTYTVKLDGRTIEVSQYPQPTQFSEVEGYKEKFLENVIQRTSSVATAGGTIYLGQMAKQENKPMAVLLERGLIVFMVPDQSLSEDQWRKIGDNLMLVKP